MKKEMIRTPWSTFTEVRKRYYLESLSDIEKILKNPEIASVSVMDYREYDPELCWNGGRYAYGEIYRRADPSSYPDTWCKVYTTSSDLDYCPKCGQFHNPEHCSMDYEIDRTLELNRILKKEFLKSCVTQGIVIFATTYSWREKDE